MLTPAVVREALRHHVVVDHPALPGRRNHLPAGVLVPLLFDAGRAQVVLTRRAPTLSLHSGEVCFPGGRPENGDDDLAATALREAHEEIGVGDVHVLGRLCSMPVYTSDYRLHPVVGEVRDRALRPEPGEVAEILRLDVEALVQPGALEGIPYLADGRRRMSPLFRVGDDLVFGATAHTLFELLEVLAPALGDPLQQPRVSELGWDDVLGWARRDRGPAAPPSGASR